MPDLKSDSETSDSDDDAPPRPRYNPVPLQTSVDAVVSPPPREEECDAGDEFTPASLHRLMKVLQVQADSDSDTSDVEAEAQAETPHTVCSAAPLTDSLPPP